MIIGHKVYNVDEDFAPIIYKERIQAVLVSPYRIDDFRNNQEIQDVFIKAGCKIFMTHEASEASIKDGVISDRVKVVMQLKEVSVEDLLPRSEITVDLKSVEEMLAGRRVLITGAAGSTGSEIVRQVAEFKPEKLMLIDQAETTSHDLELMMHKDFPNVSCDVVVTSISRRTRMEYIFDSFRPEYVFHAAAYKHVPMM
jgi:FlaA1/EpsC-like NDP-sugar epimerase